MSIRTIGIIIKNQDNKILLHDGGYFTKVIVKESEDVNNVIAKNLIHIVDRDVFRIVKVYKDVAELSAHYSNNVNRQDITMYVVEVGIFNNEYNFIYKEEILDKITKVEYIDFFEKYFIRYDKYKFLASTVYQCFLLIAYLLLKFEVFDNLSIDDSLISLFFNLGLIMIFYIFTVKYIVPKLLNYLIAFKIKDKTIKVAEFINVILSIVSIGILVSEYI